MDKEIKIGVMGCLTCNANMGCVALTYTLLQLLEEYSKKQAKYIIFDIAYDEDRLRQLCRELDISRDRITLHAIAPYIDFHRMKRAIKSIIYFNRIFKLISYIKQCDFVIDITQGDSFTDIYGLDRFYHLSNIKRIVQKNNIPLILGPQTYGPFNTDKCKKYAKKIIEDANIVISRDYKSKEYLSSFCNKQIIVATDLAFGLNYTKTDELERDDRIRVGINVSGFLHSTKPEGSGFQEKLKTNYDAYIDILLKNFLSEDKYEIHLIPHVGDDANKAFENYDSRLIIHNKFTSPMAAKSLISTMDVFIGARMHATIAAFSSGVATIPVAYSRKFSGLFNNLNYNYVIDLAQLDTNQAVEETLNMVHNRLKLKQEVESSMGEVNKYYEILKTNLFDAIKNITKKLQK